MTESIANQESREPQGDIEINVAVPRALWARAKATAALQQRPVKYLVADALEMYVQSVGNPGD